MNAKQSKRKSATEKFPIEVTEGSATVKVYDTSPEGRRYKSYTVVYWLAGRRERKVFAKLTDALAEAERVAIRLANAETDPLKLSNNDVAVYLEACETLKPLGVPLHHATREFAEALRDLQPHGRTLSAAVGEQSAVLGKLAQAGLTGVTLQTLADYYLARHVSGMNKTTVSEAVESYVAEVERRAQRKEVSDEYARVVGVSLRKFAAAFNVTLDRVSGSNLKTWLDNLSVAGATLNGYRGRLVTFLRWCMDNKLLPKSWDEHNTIKRRIEVPGKDAVIYTPQTMKRLLLAAHENMPALLPYIAIGGFAGLRTAEITRLHWEDIRLPADKPDRRFIIVRSENKTGRRVVPVHENLYAWLRLYLRPQGFVVPREILNQCKLHVISDRATNALAKLAGVTWRRNALRKSYASYRLAETGNAYTTAEETGHAVAVLKTVYREVCLPEQAAEWFGLMPPEGCGAGIIPLPAVANA